VTRNTLGDGSALASTRYADRLFDASAVGTQPLFPTPPSADDSTPVSSDLDP
jgi:hypothetical protein